MVHNHPYKVNHVKKVGTRYGAKIMLDIGEHVYFLPSMYNKLFEKDEEIDMDTRYLYVTLTGLRETNKHISPILKFDWLLPNGARAA